MKITGPDPNSIYPIKDYDKLVFLKNFIKASNIIVFLKPNGILYLSIKKGMGETLAQDKRYGNQQKFWSFFEEQEIDTLLKEARFHVMEMECTNPTSIYETHPMIRVFCRKENV